MSTDEHRPRDRANRAPQEDEGAAREGAVGGGGAVVSLLRAPPNALVDGLDARAAGLAAFVVSAVEAPAASARPTGDGDPGRVHEPSPDVHASGRAVQILLASRARETRRRQARRMVGAGGALGALAAAGFVAWTVVGHLPPVLSYTVDGAAPSPGGYVRSSAVHEPKLAFSDGTNIRMMPRTRARVLDVGRRGARLMLDDGRAHVHVAHRPGADWQVQAGKFLIHVHGTAFFVEWNASQSRLDVQMESGVVSVDGPGSGDTVVLRGGQSLSTRLDGSRVVSTMRPAPPEREPALPGSEAGPQAADAAPPRPAITPLDAHRPARGAAPPSGRWSERLADGEAAAIIAEAQRRGIANVLAGASSEDLAALADAARFRKQDHLARRVLLAQRRRFPGTRRAEEASFLIGRLADGPGGRASDALAWYDGYLREAPSGSYAAEAMGRMMLVLARQHRTDEARALAGAYLRRFPQGAYARAARALASSDP
jgi:hypothetical protein